MLCPEVWSRRNTVAGRGRYGKPADMWSLGVILYILLVGRPPFEPEAMDQSVEEDVLPLKPGAEDGSTTAARSSPLVIDCSVLPPLARDLVQRLLRHDPKRRMDVRQACNHEWTLMEDGDTHVHPLQDPLVVTQQAEQQPAAPLEDTDSNPIAAKRTKRNEEDKGQEGG